MTVTAFQGIIIHVFQEADKMKYFSAFMGKKRKMQSVDILTYKCVTVQFNKNMNTIEPKWKFRNKVHDINQNHLQ